MQDASDLLLDLLNLSLGLPKLLRSVIDPLLVSILRGLHPLLQFSPALVKPLRRLMQLIHQFIRHSPSLLHHRAPRIVV
jgi:hypothetical protein